jgi:hypothetical protein
MTPPAPASGRTRGPLARPAMVSGLAPSNHFLAPTARSQKRGGPGSLVGCWRQNRSPRDQRATLRCSGNRRYGRTSSAAHQPRRTSHLRLERKRFVWERTGDCAESSENPTAPAGPAARLPLPGPPLLSLFGGARANQRRRGGTRRAGKWTGVPKGAASGAVLCPNGHIPRGGIHPRQKKSASASGHKKVRPRRRTHNALQHGRSFGKARFQAAAVRSGRPARSKATSCGLRPHSGPGRKPPGQFSAA